LNRRIDSIRRIEYFAAIHPRIARAWFPNLPSPVTCGMSFVSAIVAPGTSSGGADNSRAYPSQPSHPDVKVRSEGPHRRKD
jgi:hypothetical protein